MQVLLRIYYAENIRKFGWDIFFFVFLFFRTIPRDSDQKDDFFSLAPLRGIPIWPKCFVLSPGSKVERARLAHNWLWTGTGDEVYFLLILLEIRVTISIFTFIWNTVWFLNSRTIPFSPSMARTPELGARNYSWNWSLNEYPQNQSMTVNV